MFDDLDGAMMVMTAAYSEFVIIGRGNQLFILERSGNREYSWLWRENYRFITRVVKPKSGLTISKPRRKRRIRRRQGTRGLALSIYMPRLLVSNRATYRSMKMKRFKFNFDDGRISIHCQSLSHCCQNIDRLLVQGGKSLMNIDSLRNSVRVRRLGSPRVQGNNWVIFI